MPFNRPARLLVRRCSAVLVLLLGLCGAAEAAQIRVHYDTGWGNRIAIRGSVAPLNWSVGQNATWTQGNVWVYTTPVSAGGFQFKPLFNDATWAVGANFVVPNGNAVVDVYPFFFNSQGRLETVPSFASTRLGNARNLYVFLPPSYDENRLKRYPVLYLQDGRNLFEAVLAFGGVEWQVDETLEEMIVQGQAQEVIVVGIDSTAARISEYTPVADPGYGGGNGNTYLDFIQLDLMPYVNSRYRTLTGPANTTIGGSSLGGLISCWAAWSRSAVFGSAICMSSSFWWNNEWFKGRVQAGTKIPARFYLDAGGINDGAADTAEVRDAFAAKGYQLGVDLHHWYAPNGSHNEASWAARFDIPVDRLLPEP